MDEDMKNQELSGSVNDIEAAAGELVHETADTVIYDPIAGTPAPDEEIKAPEIEDVPSAEAVEVVAESTLDAVSEAAGTAEDATEAVEAATEEATEVATETVEAIAEPAATEEAEEITPAPAPVTMPAGAKKPKKTTIGGQALIEGIMMCGPRRTAIAVRKADGSIYVEEIKKSASETFFEKVPLVRGCIRFFRQLISGTAALMKSAEISEEGDPQEVADRVVERVSVNPDDDKPTTVQEAKEEKKSSKEKTASKLDQFADKHSNGVMIFAAVLGLMFSVVLFILLPRLIVDTCLHFFAAERSDSIALNVGLNFIEGLIRIVIFLTYLGLTSKMKDIARVWMYHGAEHKTIACYEAGEALTVENIRKQSRFHPRCGTAFLFIVVLVSILVFCVASVFIGVAQWWVNMLVRLALVPLVGGISYEILRFCGRHDQNALCKIFIAPGLMLQRLTTKEPTDSMIEVAIASVQAVIPENSNEDIW